MSGENSTEDRSAVAAAAARIVEAGEGVREKTRILVVDTMHTAKLGLGEIGGVARDVLEGAASGLERQRKEGVIGEVFAGISDAFAVAAEATNSDEDRTAIGRFMAVSMRWQGARHPHLPRCRDFRGRNPRDCASQLISGAKQGIARETPHGPRCYPPGPRLV